MGSDSTINARVLHRKRGQTELKPLSVSLTLLVNKSLYLIPQAQCIDSDQFEISESYNSVLNTIFFGVITEVTPKLIFFLLKTKLIFFKPNQHKAAAFA